jgi:hypothetical protein
MALRSTCYARSSVCLFVLHFSPSDITSDCFLDCQRRNIWGNLKITLLDSAVWSKLSKDPGSFGKRFRSKIKMLEYDFVIMPMFEE